MLCGRRRSGVLSLHGLRRIVAGIVHQKTSLRQAWSANEICFSCCLCVPFIAIWGLCWYNFVHPPNGLASFCFDRHFDWSKWIAMIAASFSSHTMKWRPQSPQFIPQLDIQLIQWTPSFSSWIFIETWKTAERGFIVFKYHSCAILWPVMGAMQTCSKELRKTTEHQCSFCEWPTRIWLDPHSKSPNTWGTKPLGSGSHPKFQPVQLVHPLWTPFASALAGGVLPKFLWRHRMHQLRRAKNYFHQRCKPFRGPISGTVRGNAEECQGCLSCINQSSKDVKL